MRARGPVPAHLGTAVVGASSESAPRTPAGTFGITRASGRAADPGTAVPEDRVDLDDWWVSDTASPADNQPRTCASGPCPFDEAASENLQDAGPAYDHAIVIDANTDPVRPGGARRTSCTSATAPPGAASRPHAPRSSASCAGCAPAR